MSLHSGAKDIVIRLGTHSQHSYIQLLKIHL